MERVEDGGGRRRRRNGHICMYDKTDLKGIKSLWNHICAHFSPVNEICALLLAEESNVARPVTLVIASVDLLGGQPQPRIQA